MGFAEDIQRWAKKAGIGLDVAVRTVGIEMKSQAELASPVDTGQFRGNWNLSVGQPNVSTNSGGSREPVPEIKAGDTIYVSNGLPYAKRLDEGWSAQAPLGISSVVIERVRAGVKATAND